jgi:hypothetical protein
VTQADRVQDCCVGEIATHDMKSHVDVYFTVSLIILPPCCCCCRCCSPQVLSIYPTTIRRRILRHLYLRHLRASYLFRWGAGSKHVKSMITLVRIVLHCHVSC